MATRRGFLETTLWGSAGLLFLPRGATAQTGQRAFPGGELLQVLPFDGERTERFDEPYGAGLGGRLVHELVNLKPETLVTPNDKFFIRTRKPRLLDTSRPWKIAVGGLVRSPSEIALDDLLPLVEPRGVHVLECSGNSRSRSFGLLSAAAWSGVPVTTLLERIEIDRRATRVLIQGFDEHTERAGGRPGASWVFTFEQLDAAGAFLATEMNGEPLPEDHGHPVRLYVPGWYGCTCAKWVDRIQLLDDAAEATAQMREYASRTHQDGVPELARDYGPGNMDIAAMPVRVEQWRVAERIRYRVVGIIWGGDRTTDKLVIRFNPDEPYVPVESYRHQTTQTWTLWSHTWDPSDPGRHEIRLQVDDPSTCTRRLDRGYYARTVELAVV